MCRLRNIAMRDYQESVTTGQTDGQTYRRRTKWSLCATLLRRRHKNEFLISENEFLYLNKVRYFPILEIYFLILEILFIRSRILGKIRIEFTVNSMVIPTKVHGLHSDETTEYPAKFQTIIVDNSCRFSHELSKNYHQYKVPILYFMPCQTKKNKKKKRKRA